MSIIKAKIDLAKSIIKNEKVFTLKRLIEILSCSSRTAQVKLKLWDAYTSYNQNGKYYILPEIPVFDAHGLWRFKNVAFSKHGNLKKTIVHLIVTSRAGFNGRQLGEILGLSPQSFMHHIRHYPGISREKHDGVFVYFSDDTSVYKMQIKARSKFVSEVPAVSVPEAVMILVAIIKHHGISTEDILALPEIQESNITREGVNSFLNSQGLLKKNSDLRL